MPNNDLATMPRIECPACHAWSDHKQKLLAQIRRQRTELRRLNKAHVVLWKVVQIRACSYCHEASGRKQVGASS